MVRLFNSLEGFHKGGVRRSFVGENHRRNTVLTKCSTKAIWFGRFMRGLELWVGSKSRPD